MMLLMQTITWDTEDNGLLKQTLACTCRMGMHEGMQAKRQARHFIGALRPPMKIALDRVRLSIRRVRSHASIPSTS